MHIELKPEMQVRLKDISVCKYIYSTSNLNITMSEKTAEKTVFIVKELVSTDALHIVSIDGNWGTRMEILFLTEVEPIVRPKFQRRKIVRKT